MEKVNAMKKIALFLMIAGLAVDDGGVPRRRWSAGPEGRRWC